MTSTEKAFLRLNVSGRQYAISETTIRQKLDGSLFSFLQYHDNNNTISITDDGYIVDGCIRLDNNDNNTSTITDDGYIVDGCIRLGNNEYYVERCPSFFELALHYAYTGRLHCPSGACVSMLLDEVRFWRLPEKLPEECCRDIMGKIEGSMTSSAEAVGEPPTPCPGAGSDSERCTAAPCRRHGIVTTNRSGKKIRDSIWRLFDEPSSSWTAKVLNCICIFFVLVSIINLIVSTIPSLHNCTGLEFLSDDSDTSLGDDNSTAVNDTLADATRVNATFSTVSVTDTATVGDPSLAGAPSANTSATAPVLTHVHTIKDRFSRSCEGGFLFDVIEAVCIGWFTVELLVRFIVCPNKSQFIKSPLNLIDIGATVPFYVELLIWAMDAVDNNLAWLQILRILRVVRVFRVFRLARYFDSLQVMGETMWSSRSELGVLFMFLAVSTVIFSALLFYIEKDVEDTRYTSIPAAFWWCIVTLTTTGYGDVTPQTPLGKVIAGCACIVGILVLAFPVSILVEKFRERYEDKSQVRLTKIIKFVRSTQTGQEKY